MEKGGQNSKVMRRCLIACVVMALTLFTTASIAMGQRIVISHESRPAVNHDFGIEYAPADPCGLDAITCEKSRLEIMSMIAYYTPPDIPIATAVRIAECESGFNQYAKNPNSSAKGLFQFLDSTWDRYCIGDVFDAGDNIRCFMKLYPANPEWWICKG